MNHVVLLIARDPFFGGEVSAFLTDRAHRVVTWTDVKSPPPVAGGGFPVAGVAAVVAAGVGREIAGAFSDRGAVLRAVPAGTLVIAVEDTPAEADAWASVPRGDLVRLAWSGEPEVRRKFLLPAIDAILRREAASTAQGCGERGGEVLVRGNRMAGDGSPPAGASAGEIGEKYEKLKTDFISLISHELRTPLATIIGFAEIISSGLHESPEELNEMMKGILQSGLDLDGFISDAIEFLQWTGGAIHLIRTEFDLLPHVRRLLREASDEHREKNIRVSFRGLSSLRMAGDARVVSSALERMIDNAFKFSHPGGLVELAIEREERPAPQGGPTAIIKVRDHGVGLHRRQIERLFQPLEIGGDIAHHTSGHGLGLVIARECARSHHGRISVQSEGPGKGCLATMELPIGLLLSTGAARVLPPAEVQVIA